MWFITIMFGLGGLFVLLLSIFAIRYIIQRNNEYQHVMKHVVSTEGVIIDVKKVELDEPMKIVYPRPGVTTVVHHIYCPVYSYTDLHGNECLLDTEKQRMGLFDQRYFVLPMEKRPVVGERKNIFYRPDTGEQYVDVGLRSIRRTLRISIVGFCILALVAVYFLYVGIGVIFID